MKQVGVYETQDNDGKSYYFRGGVNNNWVKFGANDNGTPVWWRIVRINGDGTIRLIYAGMGDSAPSTTGPETMVETNKEYNSSDADNTYVGFYYGSTGGSYPTNHSNQTKSTIAAELKAWYKGEEWDADTYGKYIDSDAGFCNDRTKPDKNTHGSNYTQEGYGTYKTVYGPGHRLMQSGSDSFDLTKQEPTLKCGQLDSTGQVDEKAYERDLYTSQGANKGNQTLEVPVGLITIDEVIYAGGFAGRNNTGFYLYNNQYFWTMSPIEFNSGSAQVFLVNDHGAINYYIVQYSWGVRPVINLKADTQFTFSNGDSDKGTSTNPYIVITE